MRFVRKTALAILAMLLAMGIVTIAVTPANAAACYGGSCDGLDPQGRCSSDARTVAAMAVTDGMLELRWSPSCVANWGRYTPYARNVTSYAAMGIGIWARVTVWNPGRPSYGTAHNASLNIYESSWSQMTDGRPMACTGVEVFHVFHSPSGSLDYESQGWNWGPCY